MDANAENRVTQTVGSGATPRAFVNKLPKQVLREIFTIGLHCFPPVDEYLRIMLRVTQLWRSIILDSSELWTIIKAVGEQSPSVEFVETALTMSRSRSLDIYINMDDENEQVDYLLLVMPLLLRHLRRWRIFDVWLPFVGSVRDEYAKFIDNAPYATPYLEKMRLDYPEADDEDSEGIIPFPLDIYAPKMASLEITCPPEWFTGFPARFPALSTLIFSHYNNINMDEILASAAIFPALTYLTLSDNRLNEPPQNMSTYHLPQLHQVKFDFAGTSDMECFLSFASAPRLTTVIVDNPRETGTVRIMHAIANHSQNFPSLCTFCFQGMPREDENVALDLLPEAPIFINHIILCDSFDDIALSSLADADGGWICPQMQALELSRHPLPPGFYDGSLVRELVEARLNASGTDSPSSTSPLAIKRLHVRNLDISHEDFHWLDDHVEDFLCIEEPFNGRLSVLED